MTKTVNGVMVSVWSEGGGWVLAELDALAFLLKTQGLWEAPRLLSEVPFGGKRAIESAVLCVEQGHDYDPE
jgi:hypothetical protein